MRTNLRLISLLLFSIAVTVQADESKSGKELHDQHCEGCHANMLGGDGSLLYTRKNRRVNDMSALQNQVQRCENRLGLKWFQDDIDSVVTYLNDKFYKFPAQ